MCCRSVASAAPRFADLTIAQRAKDMQFACIKEDLITGLAKILFGDKSPEAIKEGKAFLRQQNTGLAVMAHETGDVSTFPLLAGRTADTETLYFICQDYQCQLPLRTREEARALINSLPPNSN